MSVHCGPPESWYHGAKCLAALAQLGGSRCVPVLVPVAVRASPVPSVVRGSFVVKITSEKRKHTSGRAALTAERRV